MRSDFVPPRLRDHTNGKIAIGELLILAAPATTNDPVGSELAQARSETGRVALVWGQAAQMPCKLAREMPRSRPQHHRDQRRATALESPF